VAPSRWSCRHNASPATTRSDSTGHDDVDSKIAVGLERLAQAFRVLAWDRAKANGLSPTQLQILVYLRHHPERERRVSALARAFDLTGRYNLPT
jgi:hypothetical protein